MQRIFQLVTKYGGTHLPILLLGETGSGKEVLADAVHRASGGASARLVRINCAGLTDSVVESELFGHERGAFTGAVQAQPGLFEVADGGTLFLDEVAELSARTQAKLLRVLETGEYVRVGSHKPRTARVRIVAATQPDLLVRIERGQFRRDLYYRLSAVTVEIPPLRERPAELLPLAEFFLERACRNLGREPPRLSPDVPAALSAHAWPGNVRELRNVIDRAAATCSEDTLSAESLGLPPAPASRGASCHPLAATAPRLPAARGRQPTGDLRKDLQAFEREQILAALERNAGNQSLAARQLGISRRTLTNKLSQHAIDRPRKRAFNAAGHDGPALADALQSGDGR